MQTQGKANLSNPKRCDLTELENAYILGTLKFTFRIFFNV